MTPENDRTLTDAPVCPYCSYRMRDAWELDFGPGIEGDGEVTCGEWMERGA